jgi:hypothetical protein
LGEKETNTITQALTARARVAARKIEEYTMTQEQALSKARALVIAACVLIALCGCGESQKEKLKVDVDLAGGGGVQIIEVDGCEYVWISGFRGAGLSHKGNCKFCAERLRIKL